MNDRSRLLASALGVLGLGLASASAHGQDVTPTLVCGIEVYPSPTALPEPEPSPTPAPAGGLDLAAMAAASEAVCETGETVLGPLVFSRDGRPQTVTESFELAEDAAICLVSHSDLKGKPSLWLDGEKVAGPGNFNDQQDSQVHLLTAGSHELAVKLTGPEGGFVQIEVRAEFDDDNGIPGLPEPGEVQIDPLTGAVDMVNDDGTTRLQNAAIEHPLLRVGEDGTIPPTAFTALVTPLIHLPGKDEGTTNYFLDWAFEIVDLGSADPSDPTAPCATVDAGLTGTTQINSPTLVTVNWDGTDATGAVLPDGDYAYIFDVDVVDEFDTTFGSITSPGFGLVIDTGTVDFNEEHEQFLCNASTDPDGCVCPASDPTCSFAFTHHLLPELGLPLGQVGNYMQPALIDKSFITTTQNPVTGRYGVVVDLRNYNAGGLVPKARGVWPNESLLRQWVSDMTGVPVDPDSESLFNFDYVQLGTSTGVGSTGIADVSFNHFLLDAMTDEFGRMIIGTRQINLVPLINDDLLPPPGYQVTAPRIGDECANSGNTDGTNGARAKFCAYNTAVPIGDVTDLGIYTLRTTAFDIEFNGVTTTQDVFCRITTFLECGVRSYRVQADVIEIESSFYVDNGGNPALTRTETTNGSFVTGVSFSADRFDGEGGVCSYAVATRDGLAVRMDSADGAVPDSCVINGIF